MKICNTCMHPIFTELECPFCASTEFKVAEHEYTNAQWLQFIELAKKSGHDFEPWEFTDYGGIVERHGTSGESSRPKQKYSKKRKSGKTYFKQK